MYRFLLLLILLSVTLGLAAAAQPVMAQDGNLLQNPGFEGGYGPYVPQTAQEHADCPHGVCNTAQVPPNWRPWWIKARSSDANPEYKPAAPFTNRIRSGSNAAQYFSFYRTHEAGFMQQVSVPTNATLQFSVWGQAWLSNSDSTSSDANVWINMRVGIDPTGGTSPTSANIVWSNTLNPFDAYQQLSVQAQARGNRVTVFTYSRAEYPLKHSDVYWDDATLFVVGQTPAPPPPPPPAPPPPSDTDGGQQTGGVHVVQPGEYLAAIARRYGVTVQAIASANNLANLNLIRPGQQLIIPSGGAPSGQTDPPSSSGVRATTQANLRLRSGPGTNHQILTVLPFGTTVNVVARNASGDWIQVTHQGRTGWVAAWLTVVSGGNFNALPVR